MEYLGATGLESRIPYTASVLVCEKTPGSYYAKYVHVHNEGIQVFVSWRKSIMHSSVYCATTDTQEHKWTGKKISFILARN